MQARIDETEFIPARTARHQFRQEIFRAWAHQCAYCGEPAQSLDHVHPKARGGLTVPLNLVPACLSCNRRKGHREVFSWWREQPYWNETGQARLVDWVQGEAAA